MTTQQGARIAKAVHMLQAAGTRSCSWIFNRCKTLFPLSEATRPALGPMQWVLWGPSLGVKEMRQDDHSPPSNAKVISWCVWCLFKPTDNFIWTHNKVLMFQISISITARFMYTSSAHWQGWQSSQSLCCFKISTTFSNNFSWLKFSQLSYMLFSLYSVSNYDKEISMHHKYMFTISVGFKENNMRQYIYIHCMLGITDN
jgi:hypothetical protein